MRRAYETGDHNSIKPKTWGIIVKNNDAKVWNVSISVLDAGQQDYEKY